MCQMNSSEEDGRTVAKDGKRRNSVVFFGREQLLGLLISDEKSQTKALGQILKRISKVGLDTTEWY